MVKIERSFPALLLWDQKLTNFLFGCSFITSYLSVK